jgi:branched-chain amino acid transport system substrate-binding protein
VVFELLAEDDQADPKTGTVVAQKLVDAGIKAMIGHFNSGVTIPASRIYAEAGIPQLSVSTNVMYTRQKLRTTFRMMADDDKQGAALGRYATQTLKLKRFAVIDDRTAYGQGLADAFTDAIRQAKALVVKREFTNDKAVDFRNILTSIRGAQPEAIFFGGYDAQAGPMARGLYAPYFYDAVMVIAAAMERAGTTAPAKVLPALRKIRHSGITAEIAFTNTGELQQALLSVFKVQNGKWVLLQ